MTEPMFETPIMTPFGEKSIGVYCCDIQDFDGQIDLLTVSAFIHSYFPTPKTMIKALYDCGIDVMELAADPLFDLRETNRVWISRETDPEKRKLDIRRIGCVEMSRYTPERDSWYQNKEQLLMNVTSFFRVVELAALSGVSVSTVALPVLGAGSQRIDMDFTITPILSECMEILKRCGSIKKICLIERNPRRAFIAADILKNSYAARAIRTASEHLTGLSHVFISYSSKDKNIADNLCAKIESRGTAVWYAPRDIEKDNQYTDYASAIVKGISSCSHFVVIVSRNSLSSQHVLNEIDLAFKQLEARNIRFLPLRIDETEMEPAFSYYLSRQHWTDAVVPPLEKRLDEFVNERLFVSMEE